MTAHNNPIEDCPLAPPKGYMPKYALMRPDEFTLMLAESTDTYALVVFNADRDYYCFYISANRIFVPDKDEFKKELEDLFQYFQNMNIYDPHMEAYDLGETLRKRYYKV